MTLQKMFELADLRITDIWNEVDSQITSKLEYSKFGFSESDDTEFETTVQNFTGMGIADETGEKEAYKIDDVESAGFVVRRPKKFTKAFSVSEEALKYSRWPQISTATKAAMNSLNQRIDTDVASILRQGFTTNFLKGPNGEALFSATHTMKNGKTQSNTVGALPLTYDNLKTAVTLIDTQSDDTGIRLLNGHRKLLIVSQFNKHNAIQILNSIGSPDTANRVSNVWNTLQGEIEMVVSNYIDDNGAAASKFNWFVIDKERAMDMVEIKWAWKPRMNTENIVNNGSKVYAASTMYKLIFRSFQWVVGSSSLS